MKKWCGFFVLVLAMTILIIAGSLDGKHSFASLSSSNVGRTAFNGAERAHAFRKIDNTRVAFIENKGQLDRQVRFYARTFGGAVFVTGEGEIVYSLPKTEIKDAPTLGKKGEALSEISGGVVLREIFCNAQKGAIRGEAPSSTKVSIFKGKDPSKWQSGLSTYNLVSFGEIYTGIELKLSARGNNVEKRFYVSPGADVSQIKIDLSGAEGLSVSEQGGLVAETALGAASFTRPVAYQEKDGKRQYVEVAYEILRSGPLTSKGKPEGPRYAFKLGAYDPARTVVIDPLLASTFIGGSAQDYGRSAVIDGSGRVYVTGRTESSDYPTTTGAYDESYNSSADAFVSRLDADLSTLQASAYIGGSGYDSGFCLLLDGSGRVYLTSGTESSNFPTTAGAYDETHNGYADVYILRLDADLTELQASTFIGGSRPDYGISLALDGSGGIYVSGETESSNYPTTSGAYDESYNDSGGFGDRDIFISRLDADLTTLQKSTFIGGSDPDRDPSIVFDGSGRIYVGGRTASSGYPTTAGAYDESHNGNYDVFISRLDADLGTLEASTFIGDSASDRGSSLILDSSGRVYIAGSTASGSYPTTAGAYDDSHNGDSDVFISRLDADLGTLQASTFIGGNASDSGSCLALDGSGRAYVAGYTESSSYPVTAGAYDESYNGNRDVFVSRLDADLTTLQASTFIGDSAADVGYSLALDGSGRVYVAGYTESSSHPTTAGAYDESYNGNRDVFVSRLDADLSQDGNPEIDIQRPAGTSIADGGTDDVGDHSPCTVNLSYTIANTGDDTLNVTDVAAMNLVNVSGFSNTTTLPMAVAPSATDTLSVQFTVDASGAFGFDMDIINNDADEANYDIAVAGAGICDQDPPEITEGPSSSENQPGDISITWKTDEDADSEVLYRKDTGDFASVSETALVKDHEVDIGGLTLGTVYGYKVRSTDESGNTVESKIRYFSTSPPQDGQSPMATTPRMLRTDQSLFPLRFDMEAEDDDEIDRVAFSFDGVPFMTDFDAPYRCYILPDDLNLDYASYFAASHTLAAAIFDRNDNQTLVAADWDEAFRCPEMELVVDLGLSTYVYTPDAGISDYSGEVEILARKNAGLDLLPGEGPHPAATGTSWEPVDEVRVYFDDVLQDTLAPGPVETDLTSPFTVDYVAAPSLHEVKVEIQVGACAMARHAYMEVVTHLITDVTVERRVARNGTGFEVEIDFVNNETSPVYLDSLSEEAQGFQLTCPGSSLYDATITYEPESRRSVIEYDFTCSVNGGSTRTFRYTAIPILSEGVSGYRLGENNSSYYHDSFGRAYNGNTLAEVSRVGGSPVDEAVDDACEESDYLIVTNPALLFGIHDPDQVDAFLAKLAELADVRDGILGYYLGVGSVRTHFRREDDIGCGNIFDDWMDEIVIADESEDVIRVYSPNSRQHFIGPSNNRKLPIPFSGLHPDDVLLVGNLLVYGEPGVPEDEIAIVDGHSSGVARGDVVLFDFDFTANDFNQYTNSTAYDPSDGDRIIVGDMIPSSTEPGRQEIILFDGSSGQVSAYYGDGPVHEIWSSVYQPGDLVAAGDLISTIDGDEIVIGDLSAQRVYIYDGDGTIRHQFDYSMIYSDRLMTSFEGLALADAAADWVYVRGIGEGLDWPVGDFGANVHSDDRIFSGRVIEHASPQYIFARGHQEERFTKGDVEIFPYSGYSGGEPGDRTHLNSLLSPGGEWADKMGDNFTDDGFLLIAGETEIIPAFSTSFELEGYGRKQIEFTDNYYANTSGHAKKPEISAGRIVGNYIDHMTVPLQTSLDVAYGDRQLNFSKAYCFSGGPEDRHETTRDLGRTALEDKGWSVDYDDEPDAATVYSNASNIDALFMAGHGNWNGCWTVDKDNVETDFNPGATNPVVYAASCLTGEYPASVNTLGEHFLEFGASAYIGATEVSYSPYNGHLAEGFFDRLELDSPIGAALKGSKRARMGDGNYGKYQSHVYHFFGDPKLEAPSEGALRLSKTKAPARAGSDKNPIAGPVDTIEVQIPQFTVAAMKEGNIASIDGGTVLATPGRPEVPAWPVDVVFPAGYAVQDVSLTDQQYDSGTDLDLILVTPATDAEIHPGPDLPDSDAWPNREYDWRVEANPDGGGTLTVWIYPLRTWPESANYTFFDQCTLHIDYSETALSINRIRTDPRICPAGDSITVELFLYNTSGQSQNVVAEAELVQSGDEDNSVGLPIKYLRHVPLLASCSWTVDSTQFPADVYDVNVRLKSMDGSLLAEGSAAVQIGESGGVLAPVQADPASFDAGETVTIGVAFENTGELPLNPIIVLEILKPDGTLIERLEDSAVDLQPQGTLDTQWHWQATVASGDCRIAAYALYDGKSTPIQIGLFDDATFYVIKNAGDCPYGGQCFYIIQNAIDSAAEDGHVVKVAHGSYFENVNVKTVTLVIDDGTVELGSPGSG